MSFWPWEIDPGYNPNQRASALTLASTCPASMFLAQAEKLKQRTSDTTYTGVGTIGHRWLELRLQFNDRSVADGYLSRHLDSVPKGFGRALDEVWEWIGEEGLLIPGADRLTEEEMSYQAGTCLITGHIDLIQIYRSLGVVADWKFYNDTSMLPPIDEDLQMYAYAVGVADMVPDLEHVEIYRVACYHLYADHLSLARSDIGLARTAIVEEAEKIWSNRTTFRPGAQCLTCLLRKACPAFAKMEVHVETTEIAPYKSGEVESAERAVKVLIAIKAVEDRLDQARAACKAWVEAHGKLEDDVSKKLWGPWSSSRDTIVDAAGALGQLGQAAGGVERALKAAKTSKSAMEDVLKEAGVPPKDRKAFMGQLRSAGIMVKAETEPRWEWRAPREKP